ncbi:MAG: phospholipid carrier-dependent glycosyltransferase [Oscillospiraceae bacterium]
MACAHSIPRRTLPPRRDRHRGADGGVRRCSVLEPRLCARPAAVLLVRGGRDPPCSRSSGEHCVASVWYYPGLSTGEYTLAYSTDGVTFTAAGTMPQGYADLFKWLQSEMTDAAPATAAYVRITASAHLELGELALYDLQGDRIGVRAITGPADADALCDEAGTVPASSTYYNSTYFDEIYHARTAYEHLRGVYPYEVSHPPLGKEILSLGIVLFGMTPFGWRCMGALFGVAMLPLMWDLLRRMFRDDRVALCGAALLACDFMHLTQTRIATIDSFATLFILLMYLFLYRYFTEGKLRHLAACGVTFGIGAATKWTCLYAGAGLGVLWALHWVFSGVRAHRAGDGRRYARRLLGNIGFCLVFFVLVPGMIYYASYYPYGAARGLHGAGMYFTREYAAIVLENQRFMFTYHAGLVATHPYASRWWQWLLDLRPILYYLSYGDGTVSTIGAFVNPLLCWGGLLALPVLAYRAWKRDRTALFLLVGYLAQVLPWVFISRLTFEYHYFAATLFLVLALGYVFDRLRRRGYLGIVYAFTAANGVLFALFYPVLTGVTISRELRMECAQMAPGLAILTPGNFRNRGTVYDCDRM